MLRDLRVRPVESCLFVFWCLSFFDFFFSVLLLASALCARADRPPLRRGTMSFMVYVTGGDTYGGCDTREIFEPLEIFSSSSTCTIHYKYPDDQLTECAHVRQITTELTSPRLAVDLTASKRTLAPLSPTQLIWTASFDATMATSSFPRRRRSILPLSASRMLLTIRGADVEGQSRRADTT